MERGGKELSAPGLEGKGGRGREEEEREMARHEAVQSLLRLVSARGCHSPSPSLPPSLPSLSMRFPLRPSVCVLGCLSLAVTRPSSPFEDSQRV
jgi:hypothetical protein